MLRIDVDWVSFFQLRNLQIEDKNLNEIAICFLRLIKEEPIGSQDSENIYCSEISGLNVSIISISNQKLSIAIQMDFQQIQIGDIVQYLSMGLICKSLRQGSCSHQHKNFYLQDIISNIIIPMSRRFSLQNANFSSSSDQDIGLPTSQIFNQYSTEYSLVLNQAKQFFSQCKEAISRFISLNQYGVGFNIPMIWTSVIKMQYTTCGASQNQLNKRLLQWNKKKPKYQGMFHQTLSKMNEVIQDFIRIEQEIKQVYLGEKIRSSPAILTDRTMKKNGSQSSGKNRNKITYDIKKILLNEELEDEFDEEEDNLRRIMTEKVKKEEKKLAPIFKERVCNEGESLQSNLGHLEKKFAKILDETTKINVKEKNSFDMYLQRKEKNQEEPSNKQSKDVDTATIRNLASRVIKIKNRKLKSFEGSV